MKKVLFIHYRTGERDGVSLEIEKRAKIFEEQGCSVEYLTGFDGLNRKNAYVLPEFDIKSNLNQFLVNSFFIDQQLDEHSLATFYDNIELNIYKKLNTLFQQIKPDLLYVHNILSMPFSLPSTTALIRVMDKYQIPTVVVNHDFWFERPFFQNPKYDFIKEILLTIPPNRPYILKHQIINSYATEEMKQRLKVSAQQIGDFFDFNHKAPVVDDFNSDLRASFKIGENDIVALQATRIVQRKAIENAIYFVRHLEDALRKISPIKIGTKVFTKDSKVWLLSNNFVEVNAIEYFKKLKYVAESIQAHVIWGQEHFAPQRTMKENVKLYNFWDAYVFADLVTYPSILEGFGNQLLEAFYFKKLPIVYEYPVYERDIKKEGYKIVSLGNKVEEREELMYVPEINIKQAVDETILIIQNKELLDSIVEKNFEIAKSNHDISKLEADIKDVLAKINSSIM